MVISRRGFPFLLLVLITAVELPAGQQNRSAVPVQAPGAVRDPVLAPIDDETAVVLPTAGKIDERPFFSSLRHPVIEYPDRETSDIVGELARKVDAGSV